MKKRPLNFFTVVALLALIFIRPWVDDANSWIYNDSFNHSSWLTFMRNRLEIAKELLALNGSIYVNIDYNEVHYLKVLMDEIFGINNFQREIIWRMGFLSGYKTSANNYIRNHDTILFYTKSSENMFFNKVYLQNNDFAPILKDSKDLRKYLINQGMTEQKINDFLQYINHTSRGKHYPLEDTWNCNKWDELNSIAIDSSTSKVEETVDIMTHTTPPVCLKLSFTILSKPAFLWKNFKRTYSVKVLLIPA